MDGTDSPLIQALIAKLRQKLRPFEQAGMPLENIEVTLKRYRKRVTAKVLVYDDDGEVTPVVTETPVIPPR